ncbi:MAG: histidinol-phosphate transaminase [Solirubrobacteraceae bacterium]
MRVRPAIVNLDRYEPGRSEAALRRERKLDRIVKLSSNESTLGPFPRARDAIEQRLGALNRYPELDRDLIERLAEHYRVDPCQVALGNGVDAIIGYLSLAYLEPGDEAVMGWPSFPTYYLDALKMSAKPVTVSLADDGAFDLVALAERVGARTRLVYVCNPNNPTGGIVSASALTGLLDSVPEDVLVVVDEAYAEFVTDPAYPDAIADHVRRRPNVAVLRTFSKIYGLAALRVGYLVGPPTVVTALGKVRHYFDLGELGNLAALASLGDVEELARRRAGNAARRERLIRGLTELGLEPLPAHGNFVATRVDDARALADALETQGVLVRPLASLAGDSELLRVTVGTDDETAVLLEALGALVAPV